MYIIARYKFQLFLNVVFWRCKLRVMFIERLIDAYILYYLKWSWVFPLFSFGKTRMYSTCRNKIEEEVLQELWKMQTQSYSNIFPPAPKTWSVIKAIVMKRIIKTPESLSRHVFSYYQVMFNSVKKFSLYYLFI